MTLVGKLLSKPHGMLEWAKHGPPDSITLVEIWTARSKRITTIARHQATPLDCAPGLFWRPSPLTAEVDHWLDRLADLNDGELKVLHGECERWRFDPAVALENAPAMLLDKRSAYWLFNAVENEDRRRLRQARILPFRRLLTAAQQNALT